MSEKMEIVYVALEKIKPYKNNPRNNTKAIDKVAKSIQEYGFKVPCVVDKNFVLITGHTRYEAAKKLKLKKIPCIIADDLSKAKANAFRIADNKVAEYSKWDMDKLKEELSRIQLEDISFADLGFDISEIDYMDDIEDFEQNEEESDGEKPMKKAVEFSASAFIIKIKCANEEQYNKRVKKLRSIGWLE